MSPYRTVDQTCPRCESQLREHEGRLVCDHCYGMLLAIDDFAASFAEIDGQHEPVVVAEPTPSPLPCPRCGQPMRDVNLVRGGHRLPGRFLSCVQHGAWIPREAMVGGYARATRSDRAKPHAGGTPVARRNANAGNAVMDISPAAAGFKSVRDAFASSTPLIGQYDLPRPLVHSMFVSAFRGRQLACPTCAGAPLRFEGDRWNCHTCSGTFVEDAALVAMISDIVRGSWELPAPAGTPGERSCPVCGHAMTVETFETVVVDRCAGHGQWFDDNELQAALLHAGDPPATLGGWLKRLFHRG